MERPGRRAPLSGLAASSRSWIEPDGVARALTPAGAWEGTAAGWRRFEPPAGARFDSGSFGRDALGRHPRSTPPLPFGPGGTRGLHVSEDGGRVVARVGPGARRPLVRRHRRRDVGPGRVFAPHALSRLRVRGPRPRGLRGPARPEARPDGTEVQRDRPHDGRGKDLGDRPRRGRPAVAEPPWLLGGASARSRTATPCGSTRPPTSASAPTTPTSASPPTSSGPTARRTGDGPGPSSTRRLAAGTRG